MLPDDKRHGSNAGYVAGCRIECCRTAHATYRRSVWRKRYARGVDRLYIDATGTQRRIRALQALGWRFRDLDVKLGHPAPTGTTSSSWTHNLVSQAKVHIDTAEAVTKLYDELCMTLGPSQLLRSKAKKWGWPTPLAWINPDDPDEQPAAAEDRNGRALDDYDEVVVTRILSGEWRLRCTPAEKREVARRFKLIDPMGPLRGDEWDRPNLAYLERLTGWKPERYIKQSEGAA